MHLNVNAFSVIWTISCTCGHAHTSIQPSTVVMIVSLDPRAACQSIGRLPVVLSRAGYNLCWVHRWQTEGTMGSLHLSGSFICETGSTGCFTFISGSEKCKVRRQFTDKWQSIPLSYCFLCENQSENCMDSNDQQAVEPCTHQSVSLTVNDRWIILHILLCFLYTACTTACSFFCVFTGIVLSLIDAGRNDVVFFTCCPTG